MTENNLNEFEQDLDIPFGSNYQKRMTHLNKETEENFKLLAEYIEFEKLIISYVEMVNNKTVTESSEKDIIVKAFRKYYESGNSQLEKEIHQIMDLWNENL